MRIRRFHNLLNREVHMKLEEIFKKHGFNAEGFRDILKCFKIKKFKSNEMVFQEGEISTAFYFIKSGQALVTRKNPSGDQDFLNILKPGACFGEIGLTQDMARTATVEAIGVLELYELEALYFLELMQTNHPFAIMIHELVIERLARNTELLRELDDESLSNILELIIEKNYKADKIIFNEGEPSTAFYLIVKGSVRIYRKISQQKEITFAYLGRGDFFGEQGVVNNEPRSATAITTEDCSLLMIPAKEFRSLVIRNASISFNILKVLSHRLRNTNREISLARSVSYFRGMTIISRPDRCMACKSCEIACAVAKSRSHNLYDAIQENPLPVKRIRVRKVLTGSEPQIRPEHCVHCKDAPCLHSCKFDAIRRDIETNTICIDDEKCVGCGLCARACPFNVISIIRMKGKKRMALKCTYCREHQEGPACVRSCPTNALVIALAPTPGMPSTIDDTHQEGG